LNLRFIPNALCVVRMLLVMPLAWLLAHAQYQTALIVLVVAAVTDALDGFLAKRFGWMTDLGKVLDPVADKLLLVTIFITLSVVHLVPLWLTVLVVLRDVVIGTGAIAYKMRFGHINGHPTRWSKLNTLLQILYLIAVVSAAYGVAAQGGIITALAVAAAATTLISGMEYVVVYAVRALAESRARRSSSSS
jgi:cardiolipin synthase